jgi:predicted nucleic acid-binding protein
VIVADTNVIAYLGIDSPYTALAESFDIKMVTLDRKLARSFPETVNLLGDNS